MHEVEHFVDVTADGDVGDVADDPEFGEGLDEFDEGTQADEPLEALDGVEALELGLERLAGPKTRFLGRVDREELRNQLRGARCFVQPGIEDFGISSVEALACGCPVVALGRGGVTDIVRHEEDGVLYTGAEEAGALATAIDKSLAIRFNKLNLERRAEEFSAPRFESQLRDLLLERLSGWSLD